MIRSFFYKEIVRLYTYANQMDYNLRTINSNKDLNDKKQVNFLTFKNQIIDNYIQIIGIQIRKIDHFK
ncbi:hypothetical protein pb186bvf_002821 [Paramecium bursaria]